MLAMKERWPYLPKVWLYHDKEKCIKRFHKLGWETSIYDVGAQAWCDEHNAVVLLSYRGNHEAEDGLLVHEAYHVAYRHIAQYMGEDEAGEEVMAYSVQVVSQRLMLAHHKWLRKRRNHEQSV